MKIEKVFNGDYVYQMERKFYRWKELRRRNTKKYTFINRQKGTDKMILILAGFQPYYWDILLNNIFIANHKKYDVCICIPHGCDENQKLFDIAKKNDWSVLYLKQDKLGLAQNVAIDLHPKAQKFFKFDEDIVVSKTFFDDLEETDELLDDYDYPVGFIVPMINISMATAKEYLNAAGKMEDFENRFGKQKAGSWFFQQTAELGKYLLETIGPSYQAQYDQIHKKNKGRIIPVPTRYSIGVMYFTRDFYNGIQKFAVGIIGDMGLEEEQVCAYCMNRSLAITCNTSVFACHLGYYPQKELAKEYFLAHPEIFDISVNGNE
ncbi:MAG: hypothetical protein K6E59_03155 [Bacilli bacterium]|nr:hypothetical protein [Bacilli bacterium]